MAAEDLLSPGQHPGIEVPAKPGPAQFDLPTGVTAPQNYVHHCHIVEHEDNDMMRPFTVTPA
jgi:FtsP/CotA-like multicopper oxidase with cupredoxin domain